jgi:hypothetical protein
MVLQYPREEVAGWQQWISFQLQLEQDDLLTGPPGKYERRKKLVFQA